MSRSLPLTRSRRIQFVPRYETGGDLNARARKALTVAPEIRAFVLDYLKR